MIAWIAAAMSATAVAAVAACLPGLHVYNLFALALLAAGSASLDPAFAACVAGAALTAYCLFSILPTVLLSAPDESAFFAVLPAQKCLLSGRAPYAACAMAAGSLLAITGVLALMALPPVHWRMLHHVLRPHYHWITWAIVLFLFMSEWPRTPVPWQTGWQRWWTAWRPMLTGMLVFLLSGLLGFIVMNRPPLDAAHTSQALMPAFVGLFTVPWILGLLRSRVRIPPQNCNKTDLRLDRRRLGQGAVAGAAGGLAAAILPGITAGIGGLLAGHVSALRSDQAFLVSQGASRAVYYLGALALAVVTEGELVRGGAARVLLRFAGTPGSEAAPAFVVGVLVAAAVCGLLFPPVLTAAARWRTRTDPRRSALASLAVALLIVMLLAGPRGLLVCATASAIGMMPQVFACRRMNCLGVILLPVALGLSGLAPAVSAFLGLLPVGTGATP